MAQAKMEVYMGMFERKTAIVMGASTLGGMGAATARRLRREGARVVVSGLGEQPLQELAQEIDGLAFEADITSKQANVDLVNFTLENYGQIDLAVNQAGLATRGPIAQETEEHLQLMAEVNYFSAFWFIRAVAEVMEEGGVRLSPPSHWWPMPCQPDCLRMPVPRLRRSDS
jgi:meso-butanediol dehydrogenase/(S,S)-butanediol dehydrogenase/diacetyl reductase